MPPGKGRFELSSHGSGPSELSGSLDEKLLQITADVVELSQSLGLRRPLRVLHIGNIANNAYLAAKAERRVGIEAYVLSPGYHHVMGFPGWEEACLSLEEVDHYGGNVRPQFTPSWFFGEFPEPAAISRTFREPHDATLRLPIAPSRKSYATSVLGQAYRRLRVPLLKGLPRTTQDFLANDVIFSVRQRRWVKLLQSLMSQFDIVNAYGPYTAFVPPGPYRFVSTEHGTLRDFVWTKHRFAEASKGGYQQSQAVMVTNQDCLAPARSILQGTGVPALAMPHPTNPDRIRCQVAGQSAKAGPGPASSWPQVLAPARHSSASLVDRGKGLQVLYDAIEQLHLLGAECEFVMVKWGDQVDSVQRRLRHIEQAGRIRWIDLASRPRLEQEMRKSAAVVDQFLIPAYGAIGLDALRVGTPLLTNNSFELDTAFFGRPAPVFSTRTSVELVEHLLQILASEELRNSVHERSLEWFGNHATWIHSLGMRILGYSIALGSEPHG